MPGMTPTQCNRFGATVGAYSFVTNTEAAHDRSVTLDRDEKRVIQSLYPIAALPRGQGSQRNSFYVHSRHDISHATIQGLSIKYPKQNGNELRLYMSSSQAFEASQGDVFYIFVNGSDQFPHVGFMPRTDWDAKSSLSPDDEDDTYQRHVFAEIGKSPSPSTSLRYPRNLKAAAAALSNANFRCEVDKNHSTFICAATGKPYTEAHHLMPLSAQNTQPLGKNLDIPENIVALCPSCHRRVHHEEHSSRIELLMKLYSQRNVALAKAGLNFKFGDLLKAYGLIQ